MLSAYLKIFGLLLGIFGLALLPPAALSWFYADGYEVIYVGLAGSALLLGAAGMFLGPSATRALRTRDGFLVVALAWVSMSVLGAIPFVLTGYLHPVDAFFESASGFTTTGSTVIVGIEHLPRSLLFFRQETQWLGGVGLVVAAIALLPLLGMGGMQLMKAETTGPAKSDKLQPRIKHTAQALWRIYLLLTIACALAYWFAGMPAFDAISNSFSTVSTGGYSLYDASFAHYDSAAIEFVSDIFMLLGAMNFAVHFHALREMNVRPYVKNAEVRAFLAIVAVLTAVVWFVLWHGGESPPFLAFRKALFQVVSIITSTGYVTDDFSVWPSLLPVLMIFICFIGGCAGSTAGGIKVIRLLVMSRQALIEVSRLIHPRLERPLKIGGAVVGDSVVRAVWSFFTIYIFVFLVLMLALLSLGVDQVTAFSAIATCINNVGPGLGEVTLNFASMSDPVTLVCAFACILGRLEVLTFFVLFMPEYWRG